MDLNNQTLDARIDEEKGVYNRRINDLQKSIKEKEEEIVEYDDKEIVKQREQLKVKNKEEYVQKEADFDNTVAQNRENFSKIEEKLNE